MILSLATLCFAVCIAACVNAIWLLDFGVHATRLHRNLFIASFCALVYTAIGLFVWCVWLVCT